MKNTLLPCLLCLSSLAGAQVEEESNIASTDEVRSQNPPPELAADDEGTTGELPVRAAFDRARQNLDGMMGIAGNEVVLYSDLGIVILQNDELRERERAAGRPELASIYDEALRLRLETLIKVQAGHDLGYDPELVDFLTDRNFEMRIEDLGGHRQASEAFKARRLTPEQYRLQIRDRLMELSWSESVTGKAPAGIGRPIVDRYVRPGLVHSAYLQFQRSGSEQERALIGMHGERVILQVLVLDEGEWSDSEQLGAELRRQYEDGERDFTSIVHTYGSGTSREGDGIQAPLEVQTLRQVGRGWHGTDDLWELARSGKVGQVVGPLLREGSERGEILRAWYLYRVVERLPATAAEPFLDRGLQHGVTDLLQSRLDRLREERAFEAVLRDAYIWPEGLRTLLNQPKKRGN